MCQKNRKIRLNRCLIFFVLFVLFLPGRLSAQYTNDDNNISDAISAKMRDDHPVLIPKCDSPRATIESFFSITTKIKDVFEKGSEEGDINWDQEKKLILYYSKLTDLIDTSSLPEKDRFARSHIICSQLSEIFDRIPIPALSEIPDHQKAVAEKLTFWRIPDTEIAMAPIEKGSRQGDWVFSAASVKKTDHFYALCKHLPYRKDARIGLISNQSGLLEHYIDYTGPLIPIDFTNHIPKWMRVSFFDLPLWKYFGTFLILLVMGLIAAVIHRITRFRSDRWKSENHIRLHIRRLILPLTLMILLPVSIHLITIDVRLRLLPLDMINDILWAVFYLISIWFIIDLGNLMAAVIIHSSSADSVGSSPSIIRLCTRLISYAIGFWVLFEGLQSLGLSLVPLIAGVSVGGLAFALAAKPTLANLLGGVLIFADKPFSLGQRVVIGAHTGTVEDIGIRSTRLRTLDGHHVSIPNDEVCNSYIENIARRPNIRRKFSLTITYDTPPEKIARAIEITQQVLSRDEDDGKSDEELGHPGNRHITGNATFSPRVYFDDLNADSLNLQVNYWFSPPDHWLQLAHASWVNMELIKRFADEGIEFAFPTQTIELKNTNS